MEVLSTITRKVREVKAIFKVEKPFLKSKW